MTSTARVSIIVPCYNEEATIGLLLNALYQQEYPHQDMEVVIADGFSTDGTRSQILAFQQSHPDLHVTIVDNPKQIIPSALNCALAAASGEFIIRLDAHSVPNRDYVRRCIAALEEGLGENVGGAWDIRPATPGWMARAIAAAAAHPLGAGDAFYRLKGKPRYVDTVPFGAFRRSLVNQIGGYDETLLSNEDYEFNVRVRQSGGRVWIDPAIRSTYFARRSLGALIRQYARYGYWKARMLLRYPRTIRWRQWLPPAFVASLLAGALVSLFWAPARWLLLAEAGIYAFVLLAAGILTAWRSRDLPLAIGLPVAIAAMHLSWGAAFLGSLFLALFRH